MKNFPAYQPSKAKDYRGRDRVVCKGVGRVAIFIVPTLSGLYLFGYLHRFFAYSPWQPGSIAHICIRGFQNKSHISFRCICYAASQSRLVGNQSNLS
jgi:hypothetical protein